MSDASADWVVGCMSGTSLDGVDAASILTDGTNILEYGPSAYRPYSPGEREKLRTAIDSWPCEHSIAAAAKIVEQVHVALLGQFEVPSIVGFHGQTIHHDPSRGITRQTGSGQTVANATGKAVVWDFRTMDILEGGQGAPLVPFYHFALAKRCGFREPALFVNLGGVANVTYVDPRKTSPEEPGSLLAFDTGPASAIIDDLVLERVGLPFDKDGQLARSGEASESVVNWFLSDAYFSEIPPKSLDRNHFRSLQAKVADMNVGNAAATLTACSAAAVAKCFKFLPIVPQIAVICGGGRHNTALVDRLIDYLPVPVTDAETHGLNGDMIEAEAFAFLASRVLRGLPTTCPSTTGCRRPTSGGRTSRPGETIN